MKGIRVGTGPRGTRVTASIPGTGINWSSSLDGGSRMTGEQPGFAARSLNDHAILLHAAQALSPARQEAFREAFNANKKNADLALLLSVIFGVLGVDRFYVGQTAAGIAKLTTIGGCGVWFLLDLFLIGDAVRKHNTVLAGNLFASLAELDAEERRALEEHQHKLEVEAREREVTARRERLLQTYGENAWKIMSRVLWIGCPEEAVVEMFGYPEGTDERVTKTKTVTIYKYVPYGRGFKLKIFVENGAVSKWEDTR